MAKRMCIKRRFLFQFTDRGFFRGFARFNAAARKGEPTLPRLLCSLHQQESPLAAANCGNAMDLQGMGVTATVLMFQL